MKNALMVLAILILGPVVHAEDLPQEFRADVPELPTAPSSATTCGSGADLSARVGGGCLKVRGTASDELIVLHTIDLYTF